MLRVFGRKPTAIVVAVHYHHVTAEDRLSFARQMDHLVRWTRPISTKLGEQLGAASHYTIVTADDGWKSFLDNAIPELARRGIPVTIFVISHRLGESIDGISSDRIISEIELRNLANENVTIGSHSATHAVMTSMPEPDAFYELVESRERLSSIIGSPVRIFCFPYGAFSLELAELARTAGYDHVFTTMPSLVEPSDFMIGRVPVDPSDWRLEFHLKIMGAYRWTCGWIFLKRKLAGIIRGEARPKHQMMREPVAPNAPELHIREVQRVQETTEKDLN